ncbi:hypothetical protein NUW58_g9791 [Xylaria curta]|uniref:Uncharacterized protein n=1 Tax=Xylaria curta TaxID=42375 RepID=A0ACC1MT19_9PEZI|nr:hypothetical protein NUW58_g9791 [Xylaria curta]
MHHDVIMALAQLGHHIMCEKPLATTLEDCANIYRTLAPLNATKVFSIGHVMRYSPYNMLLRKLLLEDNAIGDILSVHHTEPVGYWHFSHSYVRGNWRKESITAPSLLTKSCHDIDILLWFMCSPAPGSDAPEHLPTSVTSTGSLQFFRKSRKPKAAGNATNCLSCPAEPDCLYSSKRIYVGTKHAGVETGNIKWPISVVLPDIESFGGDIDAAKSAVLSKLAEDYDGSTPQEVIDSKNWFGRWVVLQDPARWDYTMPASLPKIAGLVLFYPPLDWTLDRQQKRDACAQPDKTLPSSITDLIDASYLFPSLPRRARTDIRLSPGLMPDALLDKLPPVHMCLCEYDMLLAEDRLFAERLEKRGKSVTVRVVEGEKHAWDKPPPLAPKPSVAMEYDIAIGAVKSWFGEL